MKAKRQGVSVINLLLCAFILSSVLLLKTAPVIAADAADAQQIVDKAKMTLANFMSNKEYSWLHDHFREARGVIIFPQVLKAGFFLGGSGGTGVLVVKNKSGSWSQPAFYTIGSVSFGLQAGGESAEVIMLVMSDRVIDSLYATSVKLGGDASIALGPVGAGAKSNVVADIISFAISKGIYAGLNLEGSAVAVRDKLNQAYYKKAVRPVEIIRENKVSNTGSAGLRSALRKAAK